MIKQKLISLAAVLTAALCIVSCGSNSIEITKKSVTGSAAPANAPGSAAETADESSAEKTVFHGKGYSFEINGAEWTAFEKEDFDCCFEYAIGNFNAQIRTQIDENEKYSSANVMDIGNFYFENSNNRAAETNISLQDSKLDQITVDGYDAFKLTYFMTTQSNENMVFKTIMTGILKDSKFYTITYSVTPSDIPEPETGYNDIINSFKFE